MVVVLRRRDIINGTVATDLRSVPRVPIGTVRPNPVWETVAAKFNRENLHGMAFVGHQRQAGRPVLTHILGLLTRDFPRLYSVELSPMF